MPKTYAAPQDIMVGHLTKGAVSAVYMPREPFLKMVRQLVTEHCSDAITHRKLLTTARRMPRFPMGTWMHQGRGCGCLVGEYLVAADVMARGADNIVDVLRGRDDLRKIGNDIDWMLGEHIAAKLPKSARASWESTVLPRMIVFVD